MSSAPYLRLHHVTIFVRDQERSIRFFVERLGFGVVLDQRFPDGGRWVAVGPPDGTAFVALVAPPPGSEGFELVGKMRDVVFVTDDVEAKYSEWLERGVTFRHPPKTPDWGGTFTVFEDDDGNTFALVGYDALTRELDAQRRAKADRLEAERRAVHELQIAKDVQAGLFPQTLPKLETLDYSGLCYQARKVGGDYYDFLDLGRGRLGLVIGDVAGKGIAAALLMANLQGSLRSQCATAIDDPGRLLASVNRLFCENTADNAYATLFFAEYDDAARRLRYASCGHLPALVLRGDGTLERLDSTTTVVGLFDEWECPIAETHLAAGESLVLFTDGVTEAFDESGAEFGEVGLEAALRRHGHLASHEALGAILDEVRAFGGDAQYDDVTLIVARGR